MPQPMLPGKGMAAVSVGGRGDKVALAIGVGTVLDMPARPVVRAGVAVDANRGRATYNAAVGFHF